VAKDGKSMLYKIFALAQRVHRFNLSSNALGTINRINGKRSLDVFRFLSNEIRSRQCSSSSRSNRKLLNSRKETGISAPSVFRIDIHIHNLLMIPSVGGSVET